MQQPPTTLREIRNTFEQVTDAQFYSFFHPAGLTINEKKVMMRYMRSFGFSLTFLERQEADDLKHGTMLYLLHNERQSLLLYALYDEVRMNKVAMHLQLAWLRVAELAYVPYEGASTLTSYIAFLNDNWPRDLLAYKPPHPHDERFQHEDAAGYFGNMFAPIKTCKAEFVIRPKQNGQVTQQNATIPDQPVPIGPEQQITPINRLCHWVGPIPKPRWNALDAVTMLKDDVQQQLREVPTSVNKFTQFLLKIVNCFDEIFGRLLTDRDIALTPLLREFWNENREKLNSLTARSDIKPCSSKTSDGQPGPSRHKRKAEDEAMRPEGEDIFIHKT
ncbi:unnamed protein product, partial [Mesorhabditis spiculigera]